MSGQTVTFTSTSDPGAVTWDFDGDDHCLEGSGTVVTHVFPTAGTYPVSVCLGLSTATQTITVYNRPPVASFSFVPAQPVTKQLVTFNSTSVDPDGPIVSQAWDLDGDGAFDDGTGETAGFFWLRPGTYPVRLRVTDRNGAAAVASVPVAVARRPPGVLSPAPIVRVVGLPTAGGARLSLISVVAPRGAHVGIRCKRGRCPYRHRRFTSKGRRVILSRLARSYSAGTVIELRVTKPETIGKLTRLRIRAGRTPARLDRCLLPGRPNRPIRCTS